MILAGQGRVVKPNGEIVSVSDLSVGDMIQSGSSSLTEVRSCQLVGTRPALEMKLKDEIEPRLHILRPIGYGRALSLKDEKPEDYFLGAAIARSYKVGTKLKFVLRQKDREKFLARIKDLGVSINNQWETENPFDFLTKSFRKRWIPLDRYYPGSRYLLDGFMLSRSKHLENKIYFDLVAKQPCFALSWTHPNKTNISWYEQRNYPKPDYYYYRTQVFHYVTKDVLKWRKVRQVETLVYNVTTSSDSVLYENALISEGDSPCLIPK